MTFIALAKAGGCEDSGALSGCSVMSVNINNDRLLEHDVRLMVGIAKGIHSGMGGSLI